MQAFRGKKKDILATFWFHWKCKHHFKMTDHLCRIYRGHNLHRRANYMSSMYAHFLIQWGAHLSHSLFTVSSVALSKVTTHWIYIFSNCSLFKHILILNTLTYLMLVLLVSNICCNPDRTGTLQRPIRFELLASAPLALPWTRPCILCPYGGLWGSVLDEAIILLL